MNFKTNIWLATLYQLVVALFVLWLTRFIFVAYNWDSLGLEGVPLLNIIGLSIKGLRFDLSAVAYFNALFILMRTLPLPWTYSKYWLSASTIIYGVSNGIMLAINIFDTPYYGFTGARLRWSNVVNMFTDSGIFSIVGGYVTQYVGFVILAVIVIALLMLLATRVRVVRTDNPMWLRLTLFLLIGASTFAIMRGRVGRGVPLAIPDATFMVERPQQINVVLNSPFCVLRSTDLKRSNFEPLLVYFSEEELGNLRSSVIIPSDSTKLQKRNFMTIIIESGGAEWIDALSVGHKDNPLGLMPFLDSIARHSVNFMYTSGIGRTSIGGATAILGAFPAFDPFFYMMSPYAENSVDTPANLLGQEGWTNAFFYGVEHGSFQIDHTAHTMGYTNIYNRESYNNDADHDGHWGIFDIPVAQYTVNELSKLSEPFNAVWFTVSAHGPFTLPDGFDTSKFHHKEASPERGLEYTDLALKRFFELAETQDWYQKTTFIITADHGNRDFNDTPYGTDFIRNRVPFLIFTPDGSLMPRVYDDRMLSQLDIPATIMALSGYNKPYVMLGRNAFDDTADHFGIFRGDGGVYFITNGMLGIYTDAEALHIDKVYSLAEDPFLEHPITIQPSGESPSTIDPSNRQDVSVPDSTQVKRMLTLTQAFLQDYTTRLNDNRMPFKR